MIILLALIAQFQATPPLGQHLLKQQTLVRPLHSGFFRDHGVWQPLRNSFLPFLPLRMGGRNPFLRIWNLKRPFLLRALDDDALSTPVYDPLKDMKVSVFRIENNACAEGTYLGSAFGDETIQDGMLKMTGFQRGNCVSQGFIEDVGDTTEFSLPLIGKITIKFFMKPEEERVYPEGSPIPDPDAINSKKDKLLTKWGGIQKVLDKKFTDDQIPSIPYPNKRPDANRTDETEVQVEKAMQDVEKGLKVEVEKVRAEREDQVDENIEDVLLNPEAEPQKKRNAESPFKITW